MSAPGWGVPGLGGVVQGGLLPGVPGLGGSAPGGGAWSGGCLFGRGGGIPACTEADPPVNTITDACKNITLPQLRLRAVMNH